MTTASVSPAPTFSEVFDGGTPRPHYAPLMQRLDTLGKSDLGDWAALLDSIFRSLGITFAVHGDEKGRERTWPMDLIPRIIPAAEWRHVERGLIQRVRALNQFLDDIYVGEQALVRSLRPWRERERTPSPSATASPPSCGRRSISSTWS